MKRDWNLIRVLLAHIEQETIDKFLNDIQGNWIEGQFFSSNVKENEKLQRLALEHLLLLIEADFIDGIIVQISSDGRYSYALSTPRLKNKGHDFLQAMRSDTIWDKVKDIAKSRGIELSIESIKALIPIALKSIIG